MSDHPSVELQTVTKSFGDMVAVDAMTLKIRKGEFFTLLGASGCGKTTTLRLIAGFDLPTSGQILIGGEDMSETPAFNRPVHTVFQSYALFPHLDCFENVAFPLRIRGLSAGERKKRVMAALELVRMQDFHNRRPSQLSGGQQQRVALARALVNEPQVLLLDEPLGALDLKLRKQMQTELKQMQRRLGITFIFVTHDQEEALAMSDRIALMQDGRILQLASPAELYDAPSCSYAAEFIGETNLFPARVMTKEVQGVRVCFADGQEVSVTSDAAVAAAQEVHLALRPERISIASDDHIPPEGSLLLRAVVRDVVFIGTDLRLVCMLDDGAEIVARIQNRGGDWPAPARGASVALRIDPQDLRLLTS